MGPWTSDGPLHKEDRKRRQGAGSQGKAGGGLCGKAHGGNALVSSDWFIQGFVGVEPSESKRLASGGGPPGGHPVKGTGGKEPKPKTKHPKIGGVWGYWVRVEIFEINSDENFRTGVSKHS